MIKYIKAIFRGLWISAIIILAVYIHGILTILPPLPLVAQGYQRVSIAQASYNEFFKYYNEQKFDYIYDKILDESIRKKFSRKGFKRYITAIYGQYGKYLGKIYKSDFDFEVIANMKYRLNNDKPIFYNTFDVYQENKENFYNYSFYAAFEKGNMETVFVFKEVDPKTFVMISPFINKT